MNMLEIITLRDNLWDLRFSQMRLNRSNDGLSNHRMYGRWMNMLERCYNPNSYSFPIYGARGINVCKRWMSLKNFIEDLGDSYGLTLDRIDPDKEYSLGNCRWATRKQQSKNIRPIEKVLSHKRLQCLMINKHTYSMFLPFPCFSG